MSKGGLVVYMVGVLDWHFDRLLWECLLLYELYINVMLLQLEGVTDHLFEPLLIHAAFLPRR